MKHFFITAMLFMAVNTAYADNYLAFQDETEQFILDSDRDCNGWGLSEFDRMVTEDCHADTLRFLAKVNRNRRLYQNASPAEKAQMRAQVKAFNKNGRH